MIKDGKEEIRLVVLVSGDERPPKSIGSFPIPDGRAETISREVIKQAKEWGVGEEENEAKPCLTLWDNTNVNSGKQRIELVQF